MKIIKGDFEWNDSKVVFVANNNGKFFISNNVL
jgi:hypothetical protein